MELGGGRADFERLYSIGEKIGQGGFGQVFKCKAVGASDEHDGPICVKIVPLHGRHPPRLAKLDHDEKCCLADCLFRMEHPNIACYHRLVLTNEALYTVMDRCCGLDLVDYVESNRLSSDAVQSLSSQALAAVAAVHAVGLMHRDVKLENFRFRDAQTDVLQLLDFGFAKPVGNSPAQHTITGTLVYAAPEVLDGFYCNKCDLWSAGVVIFHLFSGQPPVASPDVSILRSLHRDPVLMGSSLFRGAVWEAVPVKAKQLVRGLLTVVAAERLSSQEAVHHPWFSSSEGAEEPGSPVHNALKCCSSSIQELKRSTFLWNLAGEGQDDASEDEFGA